MLNVLVTVYVLTDHDRSQRDVHDEAHGYFRFRSARRRGPRARTAGQVRIYTRLRTRSHCATCDCNLLLLLIGYRGTVAITTCERALMVGLHVRLVEPLRLRERLRVFVLRLKFCHTILLSLPIKMCQSRQSY